MQRFAIGALFFIAPWLSFAQSYPVKPVRLIVPYTSGNTDTTARIFGQKLAERLGQQVVIDNRPGAGANIGAELAARAAPDGYALFYASLSHAINATLYKKLGYDLVKDFAPVALLIASPYILTVHPSVPAHSLKDLLALARARPAQLNYASSGSTSHLAVEYFSMMANLKMNHVPYKSGAPATVAIISGEVEVAFTSASAAMPHIKSGKLRGLGITTALRSPLAPQLPTISEAGVPGFEVSTWHGLTVPAGTPAEIIARLNAESVALLKLPDVQERYRAVDSVTLGSTPAEFGAHIRSEIKKWAKVVKDSGAVAD
jgi:tripartite-type tricarboxylate transporter receptor subunit TctC